MIGPSETSATEAASHHVEITPIFLDHNIGSNLRCTEQRMLRLINPHRLAYAVVVLGTGIIPSRFGLDEGQLVRRIAVNLVGGHMDKRRSRNKAVRRLQEINRADGVCI